METKQVFRILAILCIFNVPHCGEYDSLPGAWNISFKNLIKEQFLFR